MHEDKDREFLPRELLAACEEVALELRAAEILSLEIEGRRRQVALHLWRAWYLLAQIYVQEQEISPLPESVTNSVEFTDVPFCLGDVSTEQWRKGLVALENWYSTSLTAGSELSLREEELNQQLDILANSLTRCRARLKKRCGVINWYQKRVVHVALSLLALFVVGGAGLHLFSQHNADFEVILISQGWGDLRYDRSVQGNELRIGDETFKQGLGTHAVSEIILSPKKSFSRLTGGCGVDQEQDGKGSIECKIEVEGEELFDSGSLAGGDPVKRFDIPLKGLKVVHLFVTNDHDNITSDHADWVDLQFHP